MRGIVLIFFLAGSFFPALAQQAGSFGRYDKQTYAYYLQQDWQALINTGKAALKEGIDFYYLRMRLGIAYYEKGQYRQAIAHFNKALAYNSDNPLAAEYLYYAYKFAGRLADANLVYGQYKPQLSQRQVASPYGAISGFYSEGGLKFLSPANDDVGPLKYMHAGAQQQLGGRLSLYHGYMRISQNLYSYETVNNPGPGPPTTVKTTRRYVQNEYYLRAAVPLVAGLQAMGSLHTQAITDSVRYNNLAFMAGLTASIKLFDLSANYGRAQIRETIQQQVSLGVIFYPLKTNSLYLQSVFTQHRDGDQGNSIFYQKIGVRAGGNIWLEGYGSFGDMRNVQDMDGFYQYNTPDPLTLRLGLTGIFYLGVRAKVLVGYTYENYQALATNLPYQQHYTFTGLHFLFKK